MKPWRQLRDQSKKSDKIDFGLVIGAGIHALVKPSPISPEEYENLQKIRSWRHFLESTLDMPASYYGPYCETLLFEIQCLENLKESTNVNNKSAKQRENFALKRLAGEVEKLEDCSLKFKKAYDPLVRLCSSQHISDIISLNIDLVCERLLNNKLSKPIQTENISRHRLVSNKRIWHPHGDRLSASEMSFGLRRYSTELQAIEAARSKFKARERKNGFAKSVDAQTWPDLFFTKHLIFIGTSLSAAEWDIWFALVNRFRNFARKKEHEPKTYVLTVSGDHEHLPKQIQRLECPCYEAGWQWLVDIIC